MAKSSSLDNILKNSSSGTNTSEDLFNPSVIKINSAGNYSSSEIISETASSSSSSIYKLLELETEKNDPKQFTIEDSGAFLKGVFKSRDFISNERWDEIQNVQGKIISVGSDTVTVDCLIDIESNEFQCRAFPKKLFANIQTESTKFIIIKTSIKGGSTRIDLYPGEGLVNPEYFEIEEDWDSLKDSGLDNKLTEWLD